MARASVQAIVKAQIRLREPPNMCHDVYRYFQLPKRSSPIRSRQVGIHIQGKTLPIDVPVPDKSERSNEPRRLRQHAQYEAGPLDLPEYTLS